MPAKTTRLSDAALAVLSTGQTLPFGLTESSFFITAGQLDRKLYEEVNTALESFGGKWNRKNKLHIFPLTEEELDERLEGLFLTGEFSRPQDFGYYPTPPDVIADMLSFGELDHCERLLEPSAGQGAIVDAVLARWPGMEIDCCELLPENRDVLLGKGYRVMASYGDYDFFRQEPVPLYDRILMNPPFDARQVHIDHVLHALDFMRRFGSILVAVLPVGVRFREDNKAKQFRRVVEERDGLFVDLPEDAFKASGTNVRTCLAVLYG